MRGPCDVEDRSNRQSVSFGRELVGLTGALFEEGLFVEDDSSVMARQASSDERDDRPERRESVLTKAVAAVFGDNEDDQFKRFNADLDDLVYTDMDLISIVTEDEAFRTLKDSLRQRGCITK